MIWPLGELELLPQESSCVYIVRPQSHGKARTGFWFRNGFSRRQQDENRGVKVSHQSAWWAVLPLEPDGVSLVLRAVLPADAVRVPSPFYKRKDDRAGFSRPVP